MAFFIAAAMVGGVYLGSPAGFRITPGNRLGSFAPASSWSCWSRSLPPCALRCCFAWRFFAFSHRLSTAALMLDSAVENADLGGAAPGDAG